MSSPTGSSSNSLLLSSNDYGSGSNCDSISEATKRTPCNGEPAISLNALKVKLQIPSVKPFSFENCSTTKTTVDIVPKPLSHDSATNSHFVKIFSSNNTSKISVLSSVTFEMTPAVQQISSQSPGTTQCSINSPGDSLKRQASAPASSHPIQERSTHTAKRPSSLPIPSYMRAPHRPSTLSIGSVNKTSTSPLSVQPFKQFIHPQQPDSSSQRHQAECVPGDLVGGNLKRHTPLQLTQLCSPKRQRSTAPTCNPTCTSDSSPTVHTDISDTTSIPSGNGPQRSKTFIVKNSNLEQAFLARCDRLLYPLDWGSTSEDNQDVLQTNLSTSVTWPPLVISFHAELVLQYNPSPALLMSLLNCDPENGSRNPLQLRSSSDGNNVGGTFSSVRTSNETPNSPADWIPPGITFAITRNVHVHVHATPLKCCLDQSSWCFASHGFDCLGQHELVLVIRRRPGELLPPLSIYRYFQLLYLALIDKSHFSLSSAMVTLEALQSSNGIVHSGMRFSHLSFFPTCFQPESGIMEDDNKAQNSKWTGLLLFQPTHQCLMGLQLPNSPFLFGTFVHSDEELWARKTPLRLLLRLGKLFRSYPTPIICDRDRKPVYVCFPETSILDFVLQNNTSGSTVANLLREVCRLDQLCIRLRPSDTVTSPASTFPSHELLEILIPVEAAEKLSGFISALDRSCSAFILIGGLDLDSDSHLVCIQRFTPSAAACPSNDEGVADTGDSSLQLGDVQRVEYSTEAISIANVDRKKTGATFVAFSVGSQLMDAQIVEDGLTVQLSQCQFDELLSRLKKGHDFHMTLSSHDVPEVHVPRTATQLVVRWLRASQNTVTMEPTELLRVSWIDLQYLESNNTYLVPLPYQLAHWLHISGLRGAANENAVLSSPDRDSCSPRIAWCRVHVSTNQDGVTVSDQTSGEPLMFGCLADEVAGAFIAALYPYAGELRAKNHTRLALRVRFQPPDRVGYEVSGLAPDGAQATVPLDNQLAFSANLDNTLVPILNSWVQKMLFPVLVNSESTCEVMDSHPVMSMELHMYILD